MAAVLARHLGLDRDLVLHGLRLALAAWLAFSIATLLGIPHAYWAAMPIWVVAQAQKGLLFERAFFRVLGTLIGGSFGFGLVHLTGNIHLQLVLLAWFVALASGLTQILRGVHGYGALLSGITAVVVVLPSVFLHVDATGIAVARLVCTLIGVVVVTLVTGFFTPDSPRRGFYARVRRLAQDARAFALKARQATPGQPDQALERRILTGMSEVDASASLVAAGSIEGYRRLRHVQSLLVFSLAAMAAGRAGQDRARHGFEGPLDDVGGTGPSAADRRLAHALERQQAAEAALIAEPGSADARSFGRKAVYLAPHRAWDLAIITGLVPGLAILVAGGLGLWSGWPMAELLVLGVCIFSMVLGSLPVPQAIAPALLKGVLAGVAVAILYRLVVQPQITTAVELLLSMAPFLALGGLVRASRRTAIAGIDFNMCFLLASQAVLPTPVVPLPMILEPSAALALAALIVSTGFRLLPRRPDRQARAVAEAIRGDLRRLVAGQVVLDGHGATPARILRLMLHLSKAANLGTRVPDGLLASLNLAHAIADLHRQHDRQDLEIDTVRTLEEALSALRDFDLDPAGVAGQLGQHAALTRDRAAASALRDAAAALAQSADLLRFGRTVP